MHDGILKGIRGPHGGYELARERRDVTANDILRAVGTVHEAEEEPSSELVAKVVVPVLSVAEQEFGEAFSRISLDDMVRHAERLNGSGGRESAELARHAERLNGSGGREINRACGPICTAVDPEPNCPDWSGHDGSLLVWAFNR